MGSNIPEARRLLREALKHDMDPAARAEVSQALDMMTRAAPVRRASMQHRLTNKKRDMIREIAATHPDMHLADIAQMAGVNPGRVSEVLNEVTGNGE